jgi:hypothetical protein
MLSPPLAILTTTTANTPPPLDSFVSLVRRSSRASQFQEVQARDRGGRRARARLKAPRKRAPRSSLGWSQCRGSGRQQYTSVERSDRRRTRPKRTDYRYSLRRRFLPTPPPTKLRSSTCHSQPGRASARCKCVREASLPQCVLWTRSRHSRWDPAREGMRKERPFVRRAATGPRRSGSAREVEIFATGDFASSSTQSIEIEPKACGCSQPAASLGLREQQLSEPAWKAANRAHWDELVAVHLSPAATT